MRTGSGKVQRTAAVVATVAATALAGCGTSPDAAPPAVVAGDETRASTTVPVDDRDDGCPVSRLDPEVPVALGLGYLRSGPRADAVLGQLVTMFEADHPEVAITLEPVDEPSTLFQAVTGAPGSAPDVLLVSPPFLFGAVADAGGLASLDPCVESHDVDLGAFLPSALTAARRDGELVGLPISMHGEVLLYDRTALAAAGLEADAPPTNASELAAMAAPLRAVGYDHVFAPLAPGMLLAASGLGPVDCDGRSALEDADVVGVATTHRRLVADGVLARVTEDGHVEGSGTERDVLTALAEGDVAMATMAAWDAVDVSAAIAGGEAPGTDLAVAPVPSLGDGAAVAVSFDHVAVSAGASPERLAAAWVLLTWLTEPRQQAWLWAQGFSVPTRSDVAGEPVARDLWRRAPLVEETWRALTDAGAVVVDGGPSNVGFTAYDRAVADDDDVEAALHAASVDLTATLDAQRADPVAWVRCRPLSCDHPS